MNKQELIEKFESHIKEVTSDLNNPRNDSDQDYTASVRCTVWNKALKYAFQLDEPQVTDEQAWNKIAEAYPESVQSLRISLDHAVFGQAAEPQKVKVPAYVAEWIEYVKKKGDSFYDSFKPWDLYGADYVDADRWIASNGEEYARAWLDGYELEQELYIMPVPYLKTPVHYCVDENGEINFRQGNAQKFTNDELNKYFYDISDFAEKV